MPPVLLWWRKKVNLSFNAAHCAEMRNIAQKQCFIHFGDVGDSSDKLIFYFQHNITACLFCLVEAISYPPDVQKQPTSIVQHAFNNRFSGFFCCFV